MFGFDILSESLIGYSKDSTWR